MDYAEKNIQNKRKKPKYIPIIVAFDIETYSYLDNGMKKCIVYLYTFSLNGAVTHWRTREDAYTYLQTIVNDYEVDIDNRVVVYVHNLAYEFTFMKMYFEWANIFANGKAHKVIRATTEAGVEFRCSYALTGAPLAVVGDQVGIKKLIGDLDHTQPRHSKTVLTEEELAYAANDVLIIDAKLKEILVLDTLATIPMTKTGYTRRSVRKIVNSDKDYVSLLRSMPLTEGDYLLSKKAFQGGYTHANAKLTNKIVTGVLADDIASSYPASILQFTYPLTSFVEVQYNSKSEFLRAMDKCSMLIDVTFTDIECLYNFPYISESKCDELSGEVVDNGRVYIAEKIRVTITDVDYRTITRNYKIGSTTINNVRIAKSGYLPKVLVLAIADLYAKKTTLKGVAGSENEYNSKKVDTNGVFGMAATDPVREEFAMLGGELEAIPIDVLASLRSHNSGRGRFLSYPWAAWITAYSRYVLFDLVMELEDAGVVVIYLDTDCAYYQDHPKAREIIERANAKVIVRLKAAMDHHGLTEEEAEGFISPKDIKGITHTIGVFEDDTKGVMISEFKALGAKRYAKVHKGHFSITVAGLSKAAGGYEEYDEELQENKWVEGYVALNGGMDFFKDRMVIDAENSGRLMHTYSNEYITNHMVDYNGVEDTAEQWGYTHLGATEYQMRISETYRDFLQKFSEDEYYS